MYLCALISPVPNREGGAANRIAENAETAPADRVKIFIGAC